MYYFILPVQAKQQISISSKDNIIISYMIQQRSQSCRQQEHKIQQKQTVRKKGIKKKTRIALDRIRKKKWMIRRKYIHKGQKIKRADVEKYRSNMYLQSYLSSLRSLQKHAHKRKRDAIKDKIVRCFGKCTDLEFLVKLKRIVSILENQQMSQLVVKNKQLNARQILNWLHELFRAQQKNVFLQKQRKTKRFIYEVLIKFIKNKQILQKYKQKNNQESALQWLDKFIRKYPPFVSKQLVQKQLNKYNQLDKINEQVRSNKQFEVEQNVKLEQITNKKQQIEKRLIILEEQFQKIDEIKEPEEPRAEKIEEAKLRVKKPRCGSNSCRKELEARKCDKGDHMITICEYCGWTNHACSSKIPSYSNHQYDKKIKIVAKGQKIKNFIVHSLNYNKKQQNNIKEMVIRNEYQYSTSQKIIPGSPQKLICWFPILPWAVSEIIYKNREQECYLPLEIKLSTIQGAGLGIFATSNIDKVGSLICSYMGEMGIGSITPIQRKYGQTIKNNDSIFTVGWVQKQTLIIAPNRFSNVGRFINYNRLELCNTKASICLLTNQKDEYEIAVLITTTQPIAKGQELFYFYGKEYQ